MGWVELALAGAAVVKGNQGQGGGETLLLPQPEGKVLPVWLGEGEGGTRSTRPHLPGGTRTPERMSTRYEITVLFIGCDSIRREHTRRPRHAGGGAGARTDRRTTSKVYAKLGCPGAPSAGIGMRGFCQTAPWPRRAGLRKCGHGHLEDGEAGGAARRAPQLVLQSGCYGFSNSDVGCTPAAASALELPTWMYMARSQATGFLSS